MRRSSRAVVVAAVSLTVPAVALATTPKPGSYFDAKRQASVEVSPNGKTVQSINMPCAPADGGNSPGNLLVQKKVRITSKGTFSYKGTAKLLDPDRETSVKVTVTGTFGAKSVKGKLTVPEQTDVTCSSYAYTAKYQGAAG